MRELDDIYRTPLKKVLDEIREWKRGKGQYARYATRNIRKDQIILSLKNISRKTDRSTAYTIRYDQDIYYEPLSGVYYLNHSCNPSGYICFDDFTFRALREIEEGEELTFHYCTTEFALSAPFRCLCGSDSCLAYIRGFRFLNVKEQIRLLPLLSPFLKRFLSCTKPHHRT
ncbi:MAG TPA: SET domain-containing protein [Thermodesulfovibrionales bacterium]|nr:SET domain-containing protein [Thermodesulfovibrionales bacterium]